MTEAPPPALDAIDLDAVLAALEPCAPRIEVEIARLPLNEPFRISGHIFHHIETVVLHLEADGCVGRGEAAGVFYLDDTPSLIAQMLVATRSVATQGVDHRRLAQILPAGGTRNAFDCALWDLQAQRMGTPVWSLLGMAPPGPLLTTYTIGCAAPGKMAAQAAGYAKARAIKIKLCGDEEDGRRIAAVRAARPGIWLAVDANRSLTPATLRHLLPALLAADVQLIEQPFAISADDALSGFDLPMAIAADESIQTIADVGRLASLYDVVNIKLDKCGGLTDGLRLAQRARSLGLDVMVGNMLGTSLAMAPAWLLGQFCDVVDLDGPIFLKADCAPGAEYRDGHIDCPAALWGSGQ